MCSCHPPYQQEEHNSVIDWHPSEVVYQNITLFESAIITITASLCICVACAAITEDCVGLELNRQLHSVAAARAIWLSLLMAVVVISQT